MSGLIVPDDHNLSTDPYTFLVAQLPDSPLWRAVVSGALLWLSHTYQWDGHTGDQDAAADAGWAIFDSIGFGEIDGGNA